MMNFPLVFHLLVFIVLLLAISTASATSQPDIKGMTPEEQCTQCKRLFSLLRERIPSTKGLSQQGFNKALQSSCETVLEEAGPACASLIRMHGTSVYRQLKKSAGDEIQPQRECERVDMCL